MITDNASLKAILPAAVVAAVISGLGLFLFKSSQTPAPAPGTQTPPAQVSTDFSDDQKQAIEALVRDFLVKNPEILIEMSTELERKQTAAAEETRNAVIKENAEAIYREDDGLVGGNPEGDVTIVEFADYNCPYCKRAFTQVSKLIQSDPKVRLVMKEFPIFGEQSIGAAKVAIAAAKQGKYFEVHSALMRAKGRSDEASALRLAEGLGLDMEKLKSDMALPEVDKIIAHTRQLGEKLGVQGTPFYLVGDRAVPGAPDNLYHIFVETVADVRKNGCTVAC